MYNEIRSGLFVYNADIMPNRATKIIIKYACDTPNLDKYNDEFDEFPTTVKLISIGNQFSPGS